jgi:hypothetical protein
MKFATLIVDTMMAHVLPNRETYRGAKTKMVKTPSATESRMAVRWSFFSRTRAGQLVSIWLIRFPMDAARRFSVQQPRERLRGPIQPPTPPLFAPRRCFICPGPVAGRQSITDENCTGLAQIVGQL